jgi:hypothetical protein
MKDVSRLLEGAIDLLPSLEPVGAMTATFSGDASVVDALRHAPPGQKGIDIRGRFPYSFRANT